MPSHFSRFSRFSSPSGNPVVVSSFFLLKINPAAKTVAFAKLFLLNFELWQGKVVVVELGGLSIFAAELILGGKKVRHNQMKLGKTNSSTLELANYFTPKNNSV